MWIALHGCTKAWKFACDVVECPLSGGSHPCTVQALLSRSVRTILPCPAPLRRVKRVGPGALTVKRSGEEAESVLPFGTCVWATGVAMHPLVGGGEEGRPAGWTVRVRKYRGALWGNPRQSVRAANGHVPQCWQACTSVLTPTHPVEPPPTPPAGAWAEGAAAEAADRGAEQPHRGGGGPVAAYQGHRRWAGGPAFAWGGCA